MNYLLLTEYFPASERAEITGGIESRCFHLVKELVKNHKVTVICSRQPGQQKESTIFGAQVFRCGPEMPYSGKGDLLRRFRFAFSAYYTGKKIVEKIEKEFGKLDCVEGASFLVYPSAYFIGKKFKTKKVATWHECWVGEWIKHKGFLTGTFGELWERFSINLNWDKVISVSKFTKERLVSGGVPENKIQVIPNGITPANFRDLSAQKYPEPTICYFGRLNWQKNIPFLIQALALIKKEIPKIRGKIIGTGPAEEELKKLVKDLELQEDVIFSGYVKDYQELLIQAKACHLFVSPSTLEGFGITVIEAMALGLPYVITDIPPFIEITENGKGGEIFKQNDAEDLAAKALLLLQNPELYSRKVKEGKVLVQNYDWENIAKKYDGLLGVKT